MFALNANRMESYAPRTGVSARVHYQAPPRPIGSRGTIQGKRSFEDPAVLGELIVVTDETTKWLWPFMS